ncbi:uncharacterized protein LOC112944085 [Nothoprocta perdicaria]|uniref:uncharacterized protein LOC112944085 n=1 Tax=Nothoprocta perdicaria TaxID=30464 RepID=UPI000E1BC8D3|nr:uncharacterized protein LOC112944085 [Nothoprocta perdicaria]
MVPQADRQGNQRSFSASGEEDVVPDGREQPRATQQPATGGGRRCRRLTSVWEGKDRLRASQVYRLRGPIAGTAVHPMSEGSSGLSRIPMLVVNGKTVKMLPKSIALWADQEPSRCWVRDCTNPVCSAERDHHGLSSDLLQWSLPDEEETSSSLVTQESLSMSEGYDHTAWDSEATSSQVADSSDSTPRSFAEEFSLAPLNALRKYSAQSFDQQVENFFKNF